MNSFNLYIFNCVLMSVEGMNIWRMNCAHADECCLMSPPRRKRCRNVLLYLFPHYFCKAGSLPALWARMTASSLPWVFSSTLGNAVVVDIHKAIDVDVRIRDQVFKITQRGPSPSEPWFLAFLYLLKLLFSTSVFLCLSFIGLNQYS